MSAERLVIVRHGQTQASARMLYSGRAEVALTDAGLEQARRAGELLAGTGIDAIRCSPLRRAVDTAQAIADATGASMTVDERLIEIDYGAFEGLDRQHALDRFGARFQAWREDPFGSPVPGMEPLADALARARAATADLIATARRPLIVGHQGILRIVLIALGELERENYFDRRLHEAQPITIDAPVLVP